ncbi:response regulator transcription factor [Fundicoccus sp. Sow4_H7]|uniref:response regulator transcription factor n=1 Tax=Fundicoccus sp. Sow4_H7 TaxID=3438784 RepID=UPI003F8F47EC
MNNILVVDDNIHTQALMMAILEAEQFSVTVANDGQEALDILESRHIDLAVVDIMMPNMDGYELTKILREANNDLPILMISAKQLPADKKQGFLVGIDDYITKPFDEEEMILRVRALLRRSKIASDRQLTVGDVVLDLDAFSVTKGEDVQVLPQKEFQLLFKLLSYPGKIFTRIQLMDEIWGMDSETGWETVTVHIARLRKRFEDWDEIEIESVRGLGYRAVKK